MALWKVVRTGEQLAEKLETLKVVKMAALSVEPMGDPMVWRKVASSVGKSVGLTEPMKVTLMALQTVETKENR